MAIKRVKASYRLEENFANYISRKTSMSLYIEVSKLSIRHEEINQSINNSIIQLRKDSNFTEKDTQMFK